MSDTTVPIRLNLAAALVSTSWHREGEHGRTECGLSIGPAWKRRSGNETTITCPLCVAICRQKQDLLKEGGH
jgi:hypothetical protein